MVFFVWDFRILDNQKFFPTDIWRNIWGRDLGRISGYLWYYDRGRYFRILHHQTSPEVIEGIFGKEIWCCFAPPPENLPKFDENLRFFPPIMEAIRTFVYPWKEIKGCWISLNLSFIDEFKPNWLKCSIELKNVCISTLWIFYSEGSRFSSQDMTWSCSSS